MRAAPPDPSRPRGPVARALGTGLLLAATLIGAGCGGRTVQSDAPALAACRAKHGTNPRMTIVPACIRTAKGVMAVETEYLPGVVDCELGWFTKAAPALEAQAIAARTYLMSHLARKNDEDALIAIGPRFQCWRKATHDRSKAAVLATRDQVLHRDGAFLLGNYVAGAKYRDENCAPESPRRHGYPYDTWDDMRAAYDQARKRGVRGPFKGVYWTELLVTDNAGKAGEDVVGTPFASKSPLNRGALGQYAAACIARRDAAAALPVSGAPTTADALAKAAWPAFEQPRPGVDGAAPNAGGTCAPRDRRRRSRKDTATRDSSARQTPPSRRAALAPSPEPPTPESIIAQATGEGPGLGAGHPPGSTAAILAHFYGADVEISAPWRPEDAARLEGSLHDDGALESEPPAELTGGGLPMDEDTP